MKRLHSYSIITVLLISVLLFSAVSVFADSDILDQEGWHSVTSDTANDMYEADDSFLLMLYNAYGLSVSAQIRYMSVWMKEYGFDVYGIDLDENSTVTNWIYSAAHGDLGEIPVPTYLFIRDGVVVDTADTTLPLADFKQKLCDFFGFEIASEIGYERFNRSVFDSYSVREASARLRDIQPISEIYAPIVTEAQTITEGLETDTEKLQAIYDWVTENIFYDYEMFKGNAAIKISAKDTYKSTHSVCEGFARLTKALCNAVGIPCRMATGFAVGEGTEAAASEVRALYDSYLEDNDLPALIEGVAPYENHAWNEAYVDGRWVIVDTTWGSGNTYYWDEEGGTYVYEQGPSDGFFCDPPFADFSDTHLFWTDQSGDLLLKEEEGKLSVEAALEPEDVEAGALAFVASYDEYGRMLDVELVNVESSSVKVELNDPQLTGSVQLCVTSADGEPVTATYDGVLNSNSL